LQTAPPKFERADAVEDIENAGAPVVPWSRQRPRERPFSPSKYPRRTGRNTVEIARFASAIIRGIDVSEEGTIPDFSQCVKSGCTPIVLRGTFEPQLAYIIEDALIYSARVQ